MAEYNGGKFSKDLLKAYIRDQSFRTKVDKEIEARKRAVRNSRGVLHCINRIRVSNPHFSGSSRGSSAESYSSVASDNYDGSNEYLSQSEEEKAV